MVIDTFADVVDNKVPVRVANLGTEVIWLNPKNENRCCSESRRCKRLHK